MSEDAKASNEFEEEETEAVGELKEQTVEPPLSLSMNSIVGFSGNKTMRLKGKVKDKDMQILIDNGASQFHLH